MYGKVGSRDMLHQWFLFYANDLISPSSKRRMVIAGCAEVVRFQSVMYKIETIWNERKTDWMAIAEVKFTMHVYVM